MQFITPSQEAVYNRVLPWMKELFGDSVEVSQDQPGFNVRLGSSITEVQVLPWKGEESIVWARALVVRQVQFDPTLLQYLLRQNAVIRFGAFSIESDNEVSFSHSIVGSTCDQPELEATIRSVSSTADRYDDEIRERWGGLRALDA